MEAELNVVWVVMDNSAFGTIAGLEQMHYGTDFGCVFECDGKPYHVDYAAMARSLRRATAFLIYRRGSTWAGAASGAGCGQADR